MYIVAAFTHAHKNILLNNQYPKTHTHSKCKRKTKNIRVCIMLVLPKKCKEGRTCIKSRKINKAGMNIHTNISR